MLGLGGASALAGGLSGRGRKQTQITQQLLSPQQQQLEHDLIARLTERLADPSAGTEPLRVAGFDRINRRFETLPERLHTQLAGRGFGRSGQVGSGLKGLEIARQRQIGDFESDLMQAILGREDQTLALARSLLSPRETLTTGNIPGNVAGSAIGAGAETLTTLLVLNKLLAR